MSLFLRRRVLKTAKISSGKRISDRNYGWLSIIIRESVYELFQECLNWLRTTSLMTVDGTEILSPSQLLTSKVRQFIKA